jgi:predicted phosphodiesterase
MKIALCSDVHLEFGPTDKIKNPGDVDVLILSGDICVARDLMEYEPLVSENMRFGKSDRYHEFFANCIREFPHVIYVAGNHEHYHGDFKYTISDLKKRLAYLKNIHVLDKETFELDNVVFIGGTLWTDMNKEDPLTLHGIARMMNDFRCVENSNREVNYKTFDDPDNPEKPTFRTRPARFCPEDAVEDHKKMLDYIRIVYEQTPVEKPIVVVGHHTPSFFSCAEQYKDDTLMNGGYHSDLSEFILDRPRIKLWTHGHTHELFDYTMGDCRIVCNPRGYVGYEELAENFELKIMEV